MRDKNATQAPRKVVVEKTYALNTSRGKSSLNYFGTTLANID